MKNGKRKMKIMNMKSEDDSSRKFEEWKVELMEKNRM